MNSEIKSFEITVLPGFERHKELKALLKLGEDEIYDGAIHPYKEADKFPCPAQFPLYSNINNS